MSSKEPITATENGVRISVHAQPGAKRTELVGVHGDAIKIRVQAPPVDGKANLELIKYLANLFKLPRTDVTLLKGDTNRCKVFLIEGATLDAARRLLMNSEKSPEKS